MAALDAPPAVDIVAAVTGLPAAVRPTAMGVDVDAPP